MKIKEKELTKLTIAKDDKILNALKGKTLAPQKLDEMNKLLRELQTPLPK